MSPMLRQNCNWYVDLLLHEHHDFFFASQQLCGSLDWGKLATKYSMPAGTWRHCIHAFLKFLSRTLWEVALEVPFFCDLERCHPMIFAIASHFEVHMALDVFHPVSSLFLHILLFRDKSAACTQYSCTLLDDCYVCIVCRSVVLRMTVYIFTLSEDDDCNIFKPIANEASISCSGLSGQRDKLHDSSAGYLPFEENARADEYHYLDNQSMDIN